MNADSFANISGLFGYSLSNVEPQFGGTFDFHFKLMMDFPAGGLEGRCCFSPLRGAPIWSAAQLLWEKQWILIAQEKIAGRHYVFTEAMATWEASSNLALNFNPKLVFNSAGQLWGVGVVLICN